MSVPNDQFVKLVFSDDRRYVFTESALGRFRRYSIDPALILADLARYHDLQ